MMDGSLSNVAWERFGVIGDIHAQHRSLHAALDWLASQRVDGIVCTGDIADGPGNVDACCDLLAQAEVTTVAGNHDRWLLNDQVRHVRHAHRVADLDDRSRAYLNGLERTATVETVAGALLLCHGVLDDDLGKVWPGTARTRIERSAALDEWLAAGSHRLMVNGHLHYRVLINFEELALVNAGTLLGEHPGFCVVDAAQEVVETFELAPGVERVSELPIHDADGRRLWADTQAFDGCWEPVTLYRR